MKIILFLLLICFPLFSAEDPLIVMAPQQEWRPILYREKDDHFAGPLGMIVKMILKEAGYEYEIRYLPWSRAQEEVASGRGDLLVAGYRSDDRDRLYLPSPSLFELRRGFFYSKFRFPEGLKLEAWEDLKGYSVLGIRGFSYEERYLEEKIFKYFVESGDQGLDMILAERADLFFIGLSQVYGHPRFRSLIEDEFIDFKIAPFEKPRSFHLFTSRRSGRTAEVSSRIEKAVESLRERGELERIMHTYMPLLY